MNEAKWKYANRAILLYDQTPGDEMSYIVYFDESGNVEPGFSDKKQPFITFASHCFSESDCKQILDRKFPKRQSKEVKYYKLNKRERFTIAIDILEELINKISYYETKAFLVYKPLYLLQSFLIFFHDEIVENKGLNTGNPDFIRKRTQEVWFNYMRIGGKGKLSELIDTYCQLIKTKQAIFFIKILEEMLFYANAGSTVAHEIYCYYRARNFTDFTDEYISKESWLDTTASCTHQLLQLWRYYFEGYSFKVIYDQSEQLDKNKVLRLIFDISEAISSAIHSKYDETIYPIPDKIPIIGKDFEFCDSKSSYAVQVADLLAGAINEIGLRIINGNKGGAEETYKLIQILDNKLIYLIPELDLAYENDNMFFEKNNINYYI